MDIKKYISVGVCAALLLGAGLVGVQTDEVKVQKKGKETEIRSVQDMGAVLTAFAPKAAVLAPYWDLGEELLQTVSPLSAGSAPISASSVKSAKITTETEWEYTCWDNSYLWHGAREQATFCFSEDAIYIVAEGTYWLNNEVYDEDDNRLDWYGYVSYRVEWYADETQALVRFDSMKADGEGALTIDGATTETENKTDELRGIPLDEWLSAAELATAIAATDNAYLEIPNKSGALLKSFGSMLTGRASDFKEEKGVYAFHESADGLMQNVFGFEEASSGETQVRIADNKLPTIYGDYYATHYPFEGPSHSANVKTEIAVDDVNCTVVKKLKAPKLGKIDGSALSAK